MTQLNDEHIKAIVKATFEKLNEVEDLLKEKQMVKAALKRDLSDLAEGRIDRILERHEIDEVSRSEAVFCVKAKVEIGTRTTSPWYVPYLVTLNKVEAEVNNSIAKTHAKGSYKLDNGEIRYL